MSDPGPLTGTSAADIRPYRRLVELVEIGSKLVIVSSLVTYAAGLLITNAFLRGFGSVQIDPIRPDYVIAGLLWIFISGVGLVLIREAKVAAERVFPEVKSAHGLRKVGPIALLCAIVIGLATFVLTLLGLLGVVDVFLFSKPALIAGVVILVCALWQAYLLGWHTRTPLEFLLGRVRTEPVPLIRDGLTIIAMIMAYANFVYPHIPAMFGGGDRGSVELILGGANDSLESIPVSVPRHGRVLGPVRLILETSDAVSIAIPGERSLKKERLLRIRRELINAVIYSPREDSPPSRPQKPMSGAGGNRPQEAGPSGTERPPSGGAPGDGRSTRSVP